MADLRAMIRSTAKVLDGVGPGSARDVVSGLRDELKSRGLPDDCHCGRKDLEQDPEAMLEWYAGQIVSIVDKEAWFAVNSWINCVDKFAPEGQSDG